VLIDRFEDVHPNAAPIITRINVLSFILNGRFLDSTDLGIDHNIADPVIIESVAIIIIGLITIIFSFEDACGLCSRGPQTVIIENRTE
jgi:hypothetical protein